MNVTATKLQQLKERLEELEGTMVYTYAQQANRNREMFLISREIERIENPASYAENKNHWDGHEIRF